MPEQSWGWGVCTPITRQDETKGTGGETQRKAKVARSSVRECGIVLRVNAKIGNEKSDSMTVVVVDTTILVGIRVAKVRRPAEWAGLKGKRLLV